VNHNTCPICRAHVEGSDDTWVLTEKPDTSEMVNETTEYLMDLADRSGYATAEVPPQTMCASLCDQEANLKDTQQSPHKSANQSRI
jgi:hypothetical protein